MIGRALGGLAVDHDAGGRAGAGGGQEAKHRGARDAPVVSRVGPSRPRERTVPQLASGKTDTACHAS
jgi:hypothetical protein